MEINEKSELIWDAEVFSSGRTGSYFIYQTYRLPFYFSSDSEHNIYKIANNFV